MEESKKTNTTGDFKGECHVGLESVDKVYNPSLETSVKALENISLEVFRGRFVSVVGPSGCGKSTLLRLIAGLSPPTRGKVIVGEEEVSGPIQNVGFVFQKPVLFHWRKVLGNVLAPLSLKGEKSKDSERKARELLSLTGLEGFEDRYPTELSGGMQQRVSICRALITDPSLLLMDEPFGALDAFTRDKMNLELLKIWRKSKEGGKGSKTVLFVTHDIEEAIFLSDSVVSLSERPGRILENISVTLPRPREIDQKTAQEFNKLEEHIYHLMLGDSEN